MRSEYDVYGMPGTERSAEEMLANKLWFSTGGSFDPRGRSATSRDIFGCNNQGGAVGIQWVEAMAPTWPS